MACLNTDSVEPVPEPGAPPLGVPPKLQPGSPYAAVPAPPADMADGVIVGRRPVIKTSSPAVSATSDLSADAMTLKSPIPSIEKEAYPRSLTCKCRTEVNASRIESRIQSPLANPRSSARSSLRRGGARRPGPAGEFPPPRCTLTMLRTTSRNVPSAASPEDRSELKSRLEASAALFAELRPD